MHSNYNVLTLPIEADGIYEIGDVYHIPKRPAYKNWRHIKFDGLIIRNIDYCFGVRLHFDYNEWYDNNN